MTVDPKNPNNQEQFQSTIKDKVKIKYTAAGKISEVEVNKDMSSTEVANILKKYIEDKASLPKQRDGNRPA